MESSEESSSDSDGDIDFQRWAARYKLDLETDTSGIELLKDPLSNKYFKKGSKGGLEYAGKRLPNGELDPGAVDSEDELPGEDEDLRDFADDLKRVQTSISKDFLLGEKAPGRRPSKAYGFVEVGLFLLLWGGVFLAITRYTETGAKLLSKLSWLVLGLFSLPLLVFVFVAVWEILSFQRRMKDR